MEKIAARTASVGVNAKNSSEMPSLWRAPSITWRWWPVFLRNLLVWRKLAIPSLVGNIAEPLMWLVAFGYGMGALVGQVQLATGKPVPYILFLASGSICMSAMNAASFEALYSAFSRMHVQKTWDGIMNAPVQPGRRGDGRDAVGGLQGAVHGDRHPGRDAGPGHQPQPKLLVAWPVLLLAGVTFAASR